MKSFWKSGVIVLFALLVSSSTFGYQLAMKNGSVVQFEKYRIEGGKFIYVDATGKEVPVALADVDVERTKTLNATETPPLDLSGVTGKAAENAPASTDEPQSLGEAARAMRQQGKARATGQKHSYTDDDMAHSSAGEMKTLKVEPAPAAGAQDGKSGTTAGASNTTKRRALSDQEVSEYYDLGREQTARAMLSSKGIPPDTAFPNRADWESKLYEAKQDMVHAYFRAKERPDDDDLYNEWADKWNAFADVANDGLRRARAYLKDHPQQ